MTYEPLHHKYRPQTFAELVGQEAIAATLTNAIRQQKIAPAYLFTGARGTGKTSSARILAKSLNCLKSQTPTEQPCGQCEACQSIARGSALDIIEIDAASNTGVDNIRELIERAQFAPVQCRYKVYVIDEVHMLSNAAFNALLKTLEEPPDRVVFVLATTDPQRVLPTIISRCQRFDYRRIPLDAMVNHLRQIADKEAIPITDGAITLVAQIAQGGLRDAESLLDQLSLLPDEIDVEQVWDLVGSVPERDLLGLVTAIAQDDPEAVIDHTRRLMDRGREPLIVLQNLASFYRDLLIAKTAPDRNDLVAITPPTWQQLCQLSQSLDLGTILRGQQHLRSAEVQLKNTTQPRLWLEVTLMGLLPSAIASVPAAQVHDRGSSLPAKQPVSPPPTPAPPPAPSGQSVQAHSQPSPDVAPVPNPDPPVVPQPPKEQPTPSGISLPSLEQVWQDVILAIQPYSTQVMVRQQCHLLSFDGQQAQLGVSSQPLFKIAQGKLPNIEAAFQKVFDRKVLVNLVVATSSPPPFSPPSPPSPPSPSPSPSPSSPPSPPSPTSPDASLDNPSVAPPLARASEASTPNYLVQPTNLPAQNGSAPPPQPSISTPSTPPEPAGTPNPWEIDEVTQAAKRLAEFFAGQVVDLSEPDGTTSSDSTPEAPLAPLPETLPLWNSAHAADLKDPVEEDEEDEDLPF